MNGEGDGEEGTKEGRPDLGIDDTEYPLEDLSEGRGNNASGPPIEDSEPTEPQVRTDTALAKAIKDLVNDEAQPNEYIELPSKKTSNFSWE